MCNTWHKVPEHLYPNCGFYNIFGCFGLEQLHSICFWFYFHAHFQEYVVCKSRGLPVLEKGKVYFFYKV